MEGGREGRGEKAVGGEEGGVGAGNGGLYHWIHFDLV